MLGHGPIELIELLKQKAQHVSSTTRERRGETPGALILPQVLTFWHSPCPLPAKPCLPLQHASFGREMGMLASN